MVVALSLFGPALAAADKTAAPSIHGEYSAVEAFHATGGSGSKTLLRKGAFLTQEGKVVLEEALPNGWHLSGNLHLRRTTDPQVDKRHDVHVLGYSVQASNPVWRLTGGDFFGDLSQYSLSQALEGGQVVYNTDRVLVKTVAGISQHRDEGKQFLRMVLAGGTQYLLIKDAPSIQECRLGVNVTGVDDIGSSIEDTTGVAQAKNRVGSLTAHLRFWDRVDVDGEAAHGWTDQDSPELRVKRRTGHAVRLNTAATLSKKAKVKLGYEWAQASFNSLAGSVVPDRVNVNSRLDYRWNGSWTSDAGLRYTNDKVGRSTLNKRTFTIIPKLGLNWTPASGSWLWLKEFASRMYWEMRKRFSDNEPAGQTDSTSQEVGLDNDFLLQQVRWNVGWSLRQEDDDFSKSNDRLINSGWLGLRRTYHPLGVETATSVRWQFNYQDRPKEGGRDLTHTILLRAESALAKSLKLEQRYSVETASRLAADSDTVRGNAFILLEYHLPSQQDRSLTASYEFNDYLHPVGTEKYAEHNAQLKFLWKF